MAKRNWRKDRKLRRVNRSIASQDKESLMQLVSGAGKPIYSKTQRQIMRPSKARRIDPKSPEGLTIATRYLT